MIARSLSAALHSRPPVVRRVVSPTGLAVTALIGVTLAFYHDLWRAGRVMVERDAFRVQLPLKQYLIERLSAGELPQWFPYEGLGRSFIGISHSSLFHPFTALYFLLPLPDAYRAATLISCLLAALGAFALGRTLRLSRPGAFVAGVAFALSGYVVSVTDNIVYLYSTCLVPLFCVALERSLTRNLAWTAALAALWASVFLIGDVQTGYYYGFLALLWMAARLRTTYGNAGLRLILAVGLTALLAGVQLGPSWAIFMASERSQPTLFHQEALAWSTHPVRLATVIVGPIGESAHAAGSTEGLSGGRTERYIGYFWAESLYLGVPVVGLAILGSWWRRDLRVLTLLGCVALLLSLGRYGGLYEAFYHLIPLWSAFRYPEKFMGLASFAVAILAGAGLDALRNGHGRVTPWFLAAVLCAGLAPAIATEAVGNRVTASLDLPAAAARAISPSIAQAFLFSALVAAGMGIGVIAIRRCTLRREFMLAVLIMLIALDLSRANLGAHHSAPAEAVAFIPPFVEALRAREGTLAPGRFRTVTIEESRIVIPERIQQSLGHYAAVIVARRHALDALHGAEFHIESAKRYLTGYNVDLLAMRQGRIGLQAAGRLNVAYYIGLRSHLKNPGAAPELVAELTGYDLVLFRNPASIKPRAYLSRRPEPTDSPADLARLFARPDFLNGEVDVIAASGEMLPGPSTEGTATIERYRPEEVRVRVHTPQPAVLILLDAFDKGWTATLETGDGLPIRRANALVRAVVAPAGSHVVTFRYETPLLRAGTAASLVGVLLCTGLLVRTRRRERHGTDRA